MDKYYVKEFALHAIWGFVVIVSLVVFTAIGINQSNNDHNFDTSCIENGKSVTYIAVPGDSVSSKVCK